MRTAHPNTRTIPRANSAFALAVPPTMIARGLCRATLRPLCRTSTSLKNVVLSAPAYQQRRMLHASRPARLESLSNIVGDEAEFTTTHVRAITPTGIELSDGLVLRGPSILIAGRVFLWDPPLPKDTAINNPWDSWTPEHFAPFDVIVPKPELLIVGTGARVWQPPPKMRAELAKKGLALDVMDSVRDPSCGCNSTRC